MRSHWTALALNLGPQLGFSPFPVHRSKVPEVKRKGYIRKNKQRDCTRKHFCQASDLDTGKSGAVSLDREVDRPQKEKVYPGKRERSEPERYVFSLLFDELGIELKPGDNLYRCPWHDDTNASLSIDAERCLWYCFGCGKKGGLRALVDFVGIIPLSPNPAWSSGMIPTSGPDDEQAVDDWETADPQNIRLQQEHRI